MSHECGCQSHTPATTPGVPLEALLEALDRPAAVKA